jgi:hypothetical protein
MSGISKGDIARTLLAGILGLDGAKEATLCPALYTPDGRVGDYLAKMDPLVQLKRAGKLDSAQTQQLGYMLEELALLLFQGLEDVDVVKSYQSAGPQHDLLVSGSDSLWLCVCKLLRIEHFSGILIEAKAWSEKIGDNELQRLGSILAHHLGQTVGLGVFLTLEGASGFPAQGEQSLGLRHSRVTQLVIYHALKKPIVVLDWEDIMGLNEAGALITVLRRKIDEIEHMTGLPPALAGEPVEILLPERMRPLCSIKPPQPAP